MGSSSGSRGVNFLNASGSYKRTSGIGVMKGGRVVTRDGIENVLMILNVGDSIMRLRDMETQNEFSSLLLGLKLKSFFNKPYRGMLFKVRTYKDEYGVDQTYIVSTDQSKLQAEASCLLLGI